MTTNNDRRVSGLQYAITGILTVILIFAGLSYNILRGLREKQEDSKVNISVIKEQQSRQDKQIDEQESRISILEKQNTEKIKEWVDQNYVRKPQPR